jgi:hypothetical protein
MAQIKFYKLTALPVNPQPNSLYIIKDGSEFDLYVTDVDGVPYPMDISIPDDAITYDKIQNVVGNSKLLGSSATGAGQSPQEINVGSGLLMVGNTLTATGGGGSELAIVYAIALG